MKLAFTITCSLVLVSPLIAQPELDARLQSKGVTYIFVEGGADNAIILRPGIIQISAPKYEYDGRETILTGSFGDTFATWSRNGGEPVQIKSSRIKVETALTEVQVLGQSNPWPALAAALDKAPQSPRFRVNWLEDANRFEARTLIYDRRSKTINRFFLNQIKNPQGNQSTSETETNITDDIIQERAKVSTPDEAQTTPAR